MVKILMVVVALIFIMVVVVLSGEEASVPDGPYSVVTNSNGPVEQESLVTAEGGQPVANNNGVLDLSGQGLKEAPKYVFDRTDTQKLDLSDNNIVGSLQAEVRLLQNLKVLDLSHNQFTGVPAEIGQLTNLEVLNLSNNKLNGLPHELGNLASLKVLDLRGNNYATADLEVIRRGLPDSTEVLTD